MENSIPIPLTQGPCLPLRCAASLWAGIISAWPVTRSYASEASHSPRARPVWRIRTPDSSPDCHTPLVPPLPPAYRTPPPSGSTSHASGSQPASAWPPSSPGRQRDVSWLCWGSSGTTLSPRVGMNDLFFLSQHIVNPGGRLNMPLMMFIPADEVQLGR